MAYIIMAPRVMAYIVVDYIDMACTVMAYLAMACTGMAYPVMACIIMEVSVSAHVHTHECMRTCACMCTGRRGVCSYCTLVLPTGMQHTFVLEACSMSGS